MSVSVLLLGASGSMGFVAFNELWNRRKSEDSRKYDIVLLLRPSKKNKKLFEDILRKSGKETEIEKIDANTVEENVRDNVQQKLDNLDMLNDGDLAYAKNYEIIND